jgi:hypothetical protein
MDGQEEIQVKQTAARRPRQREEDVEEEKPEDIKGHTARGADNLSAVQKNIKDVADALQKSVDNKYRKLKNDLVTAYGNGESIPEKQTKKLKMNTDSCAVQLLFNPRSFTQTVENVFHYSFMVKQGIAALKVRDEKKLGEGVKLPPGPVVKPVKRESARDKEPVQAIVSLTMQDWRDLVEAYNVDECGVPHRTGSKFEQPSSQSAAASGGLGRRRRRDREEEE